MVADEQAGAVSPPRSPIATLALSVLAPMRSWRFIVLLACFSLLAPLAVSWGGAVDLARQAPNAMPSQQVRTIPDFPHLPPTWSHEIERATPDADGGYRFGEVSYGVFWRGNAVAGDIAIVRFGAKRTNADGSYRQQSHFIQARRSGWPLPCLECHPLYPSILAAAPWRDGIHIDARWRFGWPRDIVLPTRLRPLSLLANTCAFALIGLVGMSLLRSRSIFRTVRWEQRRRRACCGRCGYQLAGLRVCPECSTEPGPPARPERLDRWSALLRSCLVVIAAVLTSSILARVAYPLFASDDAIETHRGITLEVSESRIEFPGTVMNSDQRAGNPIDCLIGYNREAGDSAVITTDVDPDYIERGLIAVGGIPEKYGTPGSRVSVEIASRGSDDWRHLETWCSVGEDPLRGMDWRFVGASVVLEGTPAGIDSHRTVVGFMGGLDGAVVSLRRNTPGLVDTPDLELRDDADLPPRSTPVDVRITVHPDG